MTTHALFIIPRLLNALSWRKDASIKISKQNPPQIIAEITGPFPNKIY